MRNFFKILKKWDDNFFLIPLILILVLYIVSFFFTKEGIFEGLDIERGFSK